MSHSNPASHDDEAGPRVVFLLNYLPRHFLGFYEHLSRKIQNLRFLLSVAMESNRSWDVEFKGLDVRIQKNLSFKVKHHHPDGFDYPGKVHLPISTPWDLAAWKPDVVVSLEVGPRTLQAFLLRYLGFRYRLVVQVRESEITARFRGKFRTKLRHWLLPKVDGVVVNGQSGLRHVISCGVSPDRVLVLPGGTDLAVFGNHFRKSGDWQKLRLLYVGSVIPLKGIEDAVRLVAEIAAETDREFKLTMVGEGESKASIQSFSLPSNLGIEWLSGVGYSDLPEVYASHDMLLMPSLADEWGMVVNEAMACGLPVLGCTGSQAVEEMVADGLNGWSYPPNDSVSMRSAFVRALSVDWQALDAMSSAAGETARSLSDEDVAARFATFLRKVASIR